MNLVYPEEHTDTDTVAVKSVRWKIWCTSVLHHDVSAVAVDVMDGWNQHELADIQLSCNWMGGAIWHTYAAVIIYSPDLADQITW